MGVVPSGQFSLHEGDDRLELTVAGVVFGRYQIVFDRRLGVLQRDGRMVCALRQIGGVEVQATGLTHGRVTFMLVVAHPGGSEHLYATESKETIVELAARIAAFVGVQVTQREQPFQRQVREAIDEVLPSVTRGTGSPVRLPKPIAGAISLWHSLGMALAGMMLLFMCGLVLLTAPRQDLLLAIGGLMGVMGLVLLGIAAFRATRTVQSGAFSPESANAASLDEAAEAARFAPPTGTPPDSPGLFSLMRRTDLAFGLVFFAIGAGVAVLTVRMAVEGGAPAPFLIGLLFAGVGGFMIWQSIDKLGTWRAIQASPLAVEAVVQQIRQVNRRPPRYALDYQYQDPTGVLHTGQSFSLTPEEADPWRRLDVAAIVVNRDHPEQSMLAQLRPIRRSTRDERYPEGDPKAPSRWPGAGPEPDERHP